MKLHESNPISESKVELYHSFPQQETFSKSVEFKPKLQEANSNPTVAIQTEVSLDSVKKNVLIDEFQQMDHHSLEAFSSLDDLAAPIYSWEGAPISQSNDSHVFGHSLRYFKNIEQISYALKNDSSINLDPKEICDNPFDALLVKLSIAQRQGYFPRKEQIYKRLINFCFKSLVKRFQDEVYPDTHVLKKRLKVEMIKHYFQKDYNPFVIVKDKSQSKFNKEVCNFANVNFNKQIMTKISYCSSLRESLLEKIEEISKAPEQLFVKQLSMYLRECENWLENCPSSRTIEEHLESLFKSKSPASKKRSANLPWTIDMTIKACSITKEALNNASDE